MMHSDDEIAGLIRRYAAAGGFAETYASRMISGSGDTLARIARGMSLTGRRAARIVQCASDHWPAGGEWPADVPRPAPSPGSPAAEGGGPAPNLPAARRRGRDGRAGGAAGRARRAGRPSAPAASGGGDPNPSTAGRARAPADLSRSGDDEEVDSSPASISAHRRRGTSSAGPGGFPGTDAGASLQHRETEAGAPDSTAPTPGPADLTTHRAGGAGEASREGDAGLPPDHLRGGPPRASGTDAAPGGRGRSPLAAVRAAQDAMRAAVEAGDEAAVRRARRAAFEAGMRLGRRGEIASPAALCQALGVPRDAYGEALSGEGGGWHAGRVRSALEISGDRRFLPAPRTAP